MHVSGTHAKDASLGACLIGTRSAGAAAVGICICNTRPKSHSLVARVVRAPAMRFCCLYQGGGRSFAGSYAQDTQPLCAFHSLSALRSALPAVPPPCRQCHEVDGFAGVYPEHKYRIVEALQSRGQLVGMTGVCVWGGGGCMVGAAGGQAAVWVGIPEMGMTGGGGAAWWGWHRSGWLGEVYGWWADVRPGGSHLSSVLAFIL